jgi:hypothetical protein
MVPRARLPFLQVEVEVSLSLRNTRTETGYLDGARGEPAPPRTARTSLARFA